MLIAMRQASGAQAAGETATRAVDRPDPDIARSEFTRIFDYPLMAGMGYDVGYGPQK